MAVLGGLGPAARRRGRRVLDRERRPGGVVAGRSRSNALWTARRAAAAEARSTSTLILISLVVIIWMLMPASARASNIVVATPVCVRMPRPTTETLATSASWVTPRGADRPGRPSRRRRSVSARSPAATVKLTSVVPSVATFWTIMSTTMLRLGDRAEERVDDARAVGHAQDRDPRLVLGQGRAGDRRRPAVGRPPRRRSRSRARRRTSCGRGSARRTSWRTRSTASA